MPSLLDSRSHSVSEPSWGPPLHEYLARPEANLLFSRLSEEPAILRALDDFFHKRDVTYKTLETIMVTIYRPHMMRLLLDQRAVVSCMSLLENYVARDNSNMGGFFEHAFGFLGLHVLALILQVGILRHFDNWLDVLPPVLDDNIKYPWSIKAPILCSAFDPVLLTYLNSEGQEAAPFGFFRWYGGAGGDETACLPVVGGFTFRHVRFLLRQLFDGRFMFLQCCVQIRPLAWFILIYVMQCHFNKRSLDDGRLEGVFNQHRELARRYSLVSGLQEESIMEMICAQCALEAKPSPLASGPVFAINFEDAQLMQHAFTRQFHPNKRGTHKRSLLLIHELSYFVRDNVKGYPSLGLSLGETTTELIWDVLCCIGQDTRWTLLDRFISATLTTFSLMVIQRNPSLTSRVVGVLHKLDAVNMFGRYLLLPSYVRNSLPGILNKSPESERASRKDGLTAVTSIAIALGGGFIELGVPRMFEDAYSDWYKVLLFLRQEMHVHTPHSHLHNIAVESELAWRKIGFGFEFIKNPSLITPVQPPCAYSRCANPGGARFESGSRRYCSVRCQAAASLRGEI